MPFRMTSSDFERLSEIFSDTKHRSVSSLRQLSFLQARSQSSELITGGVVFLRCWTFFRV